MLHIGFEPPGAYVHTWTMTTLSTVNVTNMFDCDLNPPYQVEALPVVEREAIAGTHTQQVAAEYSLCSKLRFECPFLFEILEDFDTRTVLTHRISVREGGREEERERERKRGRKRGGREGERERGRERGREEGREER